MEEKTPELRQWKARASNKFTDSGCGEIATLWKKKPRKKELGMNRELVGQECLTRHIRDRTDRNASSYYDIASSVKPS